MPKHHRGNHGNPIDLAAYVARLESPERDLWQKPDAVVKALELRRGHVVADLGAGPGYFTLRLARKVGTTGRVYAVDVDPAMLPVLRDRLAAYRLRQVTPVLALPDHPLLPPASCDRVLSVAAYHHLHDRTASLRAMAALLRPGGALAVIDFHKRETAVGPPLAERVSREDFLADARRARLRVLRELDLLPHQYFFVLGKR